jgi:hypothetical protein
MDKISAIFYYPLFWELSVLLDILSPLKFLKKYFFSPIKMSSSEKKFVSFENEED